MIDLEKIKDNSIIVTPSSIKTELVKLYSDKYYTKNIKFIDKKELLENTYYKYDIRAIYYLHKKYHYSFSNAKEILDNLRGIKTHNDKLNLLNEIYLDLKDNNLLSFNQPYKQLFLEKSIYIYHYSKKDVELINALKKLEIAAIYIEDEIQEFDKKVINKYLGIEDEVKDLFIQIINLKVKGISLNNIYIYNYNNEYEMLLKRYALYHHLPIEFMSEISVFDTPIYKCFINEFTSSESLIDSYKKIIDHPDYSNDRNLNKLKKIINDVSILNLEFNETSELLNYLAKNTLTQSTKFKESIKICNYNTLIQDDDYVFMIGFSADNFPHIYHDNDFYSDEEKIVLGKNTSLISSSIDEENLIRFIENTKNLTISYKEKNGKTVYYSSVIVQKLNLKEEYKSIENVRYSPSLAKIEVANYKDDYRLYKIDHKYRTAFNNEEIDYRKYDHKFNRLKNYHPEDMLMLSYTKINDYNKCPFMYYLKRVLKLSDFEDTFFTKLGTFFHLVLEESNTKKIDLNDYKNKIVELFTTPKEAFFANKLIPQLEILIEKNNSLKSISSYNKVLTEQDFSLKINNHSYLYGKIDKLMIDEENKSYIIVDYKTNDYKFKKKNVKFGFDLQLPIYSLLVNEKYKDYSALGLYIQNVCVEDDKINKDESYLLEGITIKGKETALSRLDPFALAKKENSTYINGVKYLKKTDKLSSKGLSEEEEEEILKEALKQVKLASDNIIKGSFEIAPKMVVNSTNLPCSYCPYAAICYKQSEDVVRCKENDNDEEVDSNEV